LLNLTESIALKKEEDKLYSKWIRRVFM